MMPLLSVRISNPQRVIWEGEAEWISSENTQGAFDVLPMHANFITIITNKEIRVKTREKILTYTYPQSILYAHNNKVSVYTNI